MGAGASMVGVSGHICGRRYASFWGRDLAATRLGGMASPGTKHAGLHRMLLNTCLSWSFLQVIFKFLCVQSQRQSGVLLWGRDSPKLELLGLFWAG